MDSSDDSDDDSAKENQLESDTDGGGADKGVPNEVQTTCEESSKTSSNNTAASMFFLPDLLGQGHVQRPKLDEEGCHEVTGRLRCTRT